MPKFLIYQTEEEAWEKAEEEGEAHNLPYWQNPDVNVTKTITEPMYTNDGEWALEVTDYSTLTEVEEEQIVEELNMDEIE